MRDGADHMYDGPIIDSFLHGPWLGEEDPKVKRGDRDDWAADPRLARVMHTFHHDGETPEGRTATEVLATMESCGVDRALLIAKVYYAAGEPEVAAVHRQLGAVADQSGGRLGTVATVVPPELGADSYWDVMQGPRLIEAAYGERKLTGVHVTPAPWGIQPNDKWLYPLYAKCVELGLALFTYVGMPGPLWPMEHNHPKYLDDVALAFPDLVIVAHHIGDPWTDVSVRLAARHPNLYICTSAWHPKTYPPALLDFMRGSWHGTRGCTKVLFASDWPLLDMDRAVRAARALDLPEAELRCFLHDNTAGLFWDEAS